MLTGLAGAVVGGILGFLIGKYFSKIGGVCPLLCDPKVSTIYFALLGFLLLYKK